MISIGNPIRIDDLVNAKATTKTYDSNSRLIQEMLANGLKVGYSYDRLGRPIAIALPDSTG